MRYLESYVKHLHTQSRAYPIFGNVLQNIGQHPVEIFKGLIEYIRTNGSPAKVYLGPFLMVIIDKPEDLKTVLMSQNCLDKPYYYQFYPRKTSIMASTCEFFFFCPEKLRFFLDKKDVFLRNSVSNTNVSYY